MTNPKSIKELCKLIWYLEDKYSLLDLDIEGIKVWQYTRIVIYYKLAENSGILSKPHNEMSKLDELKNLFGYIKNSIQDNYFTLSKSDVIVFPHSRSVLADDKLIDIYTQYYIDEVLNKKSKILELENAYLGKHKRKRKDYSHYNDWIILLHLITKKFYKSNIDPAQKQVIINVQNEINQIVEANFNLLSFVDNQIKTFKAQYDLYKLLFEKTSPKCLYTVVAYGMQAPMIKAAKDSNIEIIEFQHGTISKYHLGYSYPKSNTKLDYFPDKFIVWNEYWQKVIKYPIALDKIKIDKFRHLEYEKLKYGHIKREAKEILVISQGAITEEIASKILTNLNKFDGYKLNYKLHPGEFGRWQKNASLVELSKQSNVTIVTNETPLYELFAKCSTQIGVFSTALFEGVEFGCKTILLNINGIEYMDKFIDLYNPEIID